MRLSVLLVACFAALAAGSDFSGPWIGILGAPSSVSCDTVDGVLPRSAISGSSCFAIQYAKWIEQSGARAIGIPYDASPALLDTLFEGLNGVLFTGGGLSLTPSNPYYRTAESIFRRVQSINDAGISFPLHGTCMGFELLSILAANDSSVLVPGFDSEAVSWPLTLTSTADKSSLIADAPPAIRTILTTQNVTENLHHSGVHPSQFAPSTRLGSFFNLLSTNADRKGAHFSSTIQAWKYPITGTQWHPERQQFEWVPGFGLNHSADAIAAMRYIGDHFVGLARRSGNRATRPAVQRAIAALSTYSMPTTPMSSDILSGYQVLSFNAPADDAMGPLPSATA